MKPAGSFADQPIRSLQTMLRTIASIEPRQMNVMPDGVYGSQTAAAVRSFQRRQGLPVTGIADQATHERIVWEYQRAYIEAEKARPVQVTLDPGQVLQRGARNPHLYLIQSMLTVLHQLEPGIPAPGHTGVLDDATAEAVAVLQTYAGLPPTGEVDKRTWKDLALYYALAADQLENLEDL